MKTFRQFTKENPEIIRYIAARGSLATIASVSGLFYFASHVLEANPNNQTPPTSCATNDHLSSMSLE